MEGPHGRDACPQPRLPAKGADRLPSNPRGQALAENHSTGGPAGGRIAGVTPRFVPGLELARDFYATVVRPLLDVEFPWLEHAAALIGPGSDVAGYDTERSTDHDWGPRLQVFLADGDAGNASEVSRRAARITAMLADRLPGE